ncbi:MAG: acetyl-CoA carboxylase carboxyltransferase subunit alpha [Chlamydiota bacterium]
MSMLEHEKQIFEYEKILKQLKEQNQDKVIWSQDEIKSLEGKLETLKKETYTKLTPIERLAICRHPKRPRSLDYIRNIFDAFEEIHGDRLYRDDHAIITGFAKLGEQKFVVVAQEKGCDTESRLFRNFGMPYPEGYRKAMRVMKLAEKFHLPVISLIDTPGAFAGLEAEERGQGWAIAENLLDMSRLKTPTISLLIGEGCSGGALGIGVSDKILMLEHAYYSVISPEACASILWKDGTAEELMHAKDLVVKALKLHPEDLMQLGIIDTIIKEPLGGAHYDIQAVYTKVKETILETLAPLQLQSMEDLLEQRYQKYRKIGKFLEDAGV